MEQVSPTMEEPTATRPTSLGGGAHDEGDPTNASGGEETWTVVGSLGGPIGARLEAIGDAPSSSAEGLSMATEQATPTAASVAQMGFRQESEHNNNRGGALYGRLL